jgi:hypothetical protein
VNTLTLDVNIVDKMLIDIVKMFDRLSEGLEQFVFVTKQEIMFIKSETSRQKLC